MKVRRIGNAKYDMQAGAWVIKGVRNQFYMNERLLDTSPEMKAVKKLVRKIPESTPPFRFREKREAFLKARQEYKERKLEALREVIARIEEESRDFPLLLHAENQNQRRRDWRYCLFKGQVYEFDKPDYSVDKMMEEINQLENQVPDTAGII